jgi:hypothetical protein
VAATMRPEGAALSIGGSSESARARVLWMRGRWDEALELIGSAGFALDQRGTVTTAELLACGACEMFVDRGDLDAAALTAARFVTPILSLARHAALARARIHHAVGEHDAALALLDDERADASAPGGSLWKLAEILELALEIHLADTRADEAHAAMAELETLATRAPAGSSAGCWPCGPALWSTATSTWPAPTATWPRPSRGRWSGPTPSWCSASSTKSRPATSPRRTGLIRAVDTGAVQVGGAAATDGHSRSV